MEQRDGARNMIQRRFDLKVDPVVPTEEASAKPSEEVLPAPPPAPIPREASDLELRERQMRWVKERLRFEVTAETRDPPQGSK